MSTKINSIMEHPLIKLLLSIVSSFIIGGVLVFYWVEQKEIEPRYAVSNSEMIAEATTDPSRLRLLWDNEEVQNVYSIKIAIWNAGRQYLDTTSISATDPIRVTYPSDIQILYADFIKTSRDNLSLTATDLYSTGTRAIQIEIVGDEALEKRDGGVLKILYTSQSSDEFAVTGRIKGSKQGFKRISWGSVIWPKGIFLNIADASWFLFGLFMISMAIKFRDNRKLMRPLLFPGILLLIWGAVSMYILVERLSSPHWIN